MNAIASILISLFAFSAQAQPTANECRMATEELSQRLAQYQQLSQAFLQSNQALEDVYSNFAERLAKATDKDRAQIAEHFKRSGEHLKAARAQNQLALNELEAQTEVLFKKVGWCSGEPVEVRLYVHSVKILQQEGPMLKVLYTTTTDLCTRPKGFKVVQESQSIRRIQITGSRVKCLSPGSRFRREVEIEIGPLPPGHYELRFEASQEGHYFSEKVTVPN